MVLIPNADTVFDVEGNTGGGDIASNRPVRRGLSPGMCARSSYGNREILGLTGKHCRSASGRRGAEADDERTQEV